MSKPSQLELHDTDSEASLGHLDSVSLPSEPPDIRNWFSSYIYESPELDSFQDSDGARETCHEEEINGKSGNNHRLGDDDGACGAAPLKLSHGIESESLQLLSEPPDIGNWFSSYVYESLPLDTAWDFAISDDEDGMLYVGEKSSNQNREHSMASIGVEKTDLFTQMDISDGVEKGANLVEDARLNHQSVCEENDGVDLQSSSTPSLTIADKVFDPTLSEERAVYNSHNSLERNGSTLHPASANKTNNVGSEDGKPVDRSVEGSNFVGDCPEKNTHTTTSPQTTDRRRSMKETELAEDGFVSVRKRSRRSNDENASLFTNGVKPTLKHEKDGIVRKVLSEISNSHYQNIVGCTGKWSCPQKNKPELGPPLKQLRLDQWVRRV